MSVRVVGTFATASAAHRAGAAARSHLPEGRGARRTGRRLSLTVRTASVAEARARLDRILAELRPFETSG